MGKRAKPEEIIAKLREVEVRLSQDETIGRAVCAIGVSEQSYCHWRKEYAAKLMSSFDAVDGVPHPAPRSW